MNIKYVGTNLLNIYWHFFSFYTNSQNLFLSRIVSTTGGVLIGQFEQYRFAAVSFTTMCFLCDPGVRRFQILFIAGFGLVQTHPLQRLLLPHASSTRLQPPILVHCWRCFQSWKSLANSCQICSLSTGAGAGQPMGHQ